ncbi:hypothetical protein LCGC14_0659190 [marine sediment metagenome]|uniref:Uncharacterized protein n=1 Tax=marine sediment metagenome TaxID=412755 RepID=A0A0F9U2F4_9ZZZZ
MPNAAGFKTHFGLARQTSILTAVVPTDRIPLISEGIEFDYQDKLYDYLQGIAAIPNQINSFKGVTGSLESEIVYTQKSGSEFVSASQLIVAAMGVCTFTGGSNQITMQDDLTEIFYLAWDKDVHATNPWEALGCMVNTMTLTCDEKESLKGTFDMAIHELTIDGSAPSGGAVSDLTSLPQDDAHPVMLKDFTIRFADHAGAPDSGDNMAISAFTVTLNNNLSSQEQATPDAGSSTMLDYLHADPGLALYPVRNGFREVLLEITIPRYQSDFFTNALTAKTDLQATFESLDPSSDASEFDLLFPRLRVETVSNPIAGPGLVTQTISFRCLKWNSTSDLTFSDSGAVSGAPEEDSELWIETDDQRVATMTS